MRRSPFVLLATLVAGVAHAQQQLLPIRPLGAIVATTSEELMSVWQVHPLSDGHVLVNDPIGKRLLLFDSTLTHFTVVADTSASAAKKYTAMSGLLAYAGDSSLFIDGGSLSMLIIEPGGKINRVMAAPKGDLGGVGYSYMQDYGAAFDGVGHVVSKWPPNRPALVRGPTGAIAPVPAVTAGPPSPPDSQPIVRIDVITKKADTAAWLVASNLIQHPSPSGIGTIVVRNPMPVQDDWTVLADGTIAVVRELTYQIDWYGPSGTRTRSPKIDHAWERLTDSAKTVVIDSARSADSTATAKMQAMLDSAGRGMGSGAGQYSFLPAGFKLQPPQAYADPQDLPDYRPPFMGTGNVKADAAGHIWIRVNQSAPLAGGPVYDVVDRQGKLIDRVQIPGATTIVGFGPGTVYLSSREGAGVRLARARIR
jgi:hypothetical protein